MIRLRAGRLQAEVLPSVGGSLASFDWMHGAGSRPLLRHANAADIRDAREAALFPMVPWADRIFGGGFDYEGRRWRLSPPSAGPHPHGYGWTAPWSVVEQGPAHIRLAHAWREPDDFQYHCALSYFLSPTGIDVEICVRNLGSCSMPFGLGLHPYLPRTTGTRILLRANSWLPASSDGLLGPAQLMCTIQNTDGLLCAPVSGINGIAAGWSGNIRVEQPEQGLAMEMHASGAIARHLHIYAPANAAFVCLEPVSHLVNDHAANPAAVDALSPGQELWGRCSFTVHERF